MTTTLSLNEERAERGRQALLPRLEQDDLRTAIIDLFADLYHLVGYGGILNDEEEEALSDLLDLGFDHYMAEVREEEEEEVQA